MPLDPHFKAVAFDMDGTFIETVVDYVRLANVVFDEMTAAGVPENEINRGASQSEMTSGMRWLINNGKKDLANSMYSKIADKTTDIEMEHSSIARPFDGAVEVLELLKSKGYRTGILTRGGRSYAEHILGKCNVLHMFDAIVARDDFPDDEAKPSPKAMFNLGTAMGVAPEEILFLGDHKYDWMTARDSGAGFYGVLSGGFDIKDWNNVSRNIPVLKSVQSLLDII